MSRNDLQKSKKFPGRDLNTSQDKLDKLPKICPFMSRAILETKPITRQRNLHVLCMMKLCALWNPEHKKCSLTMIAEELINLQNGV